MARSVNEEEFANRSNEILDTALQLIYTRGYEQMTIQDILEKLGISKGAFYHYFKSKQELLEALIERMSDQMLQLLEPVMTNPELQSIPKLQYFFNSAAAWKTARKELMLSLLRVWYHDDNVLVREKLRLMALRRILPLLTQVICQGVREGVMNTAYPDHIAEVWFSMVYGMSETLVELALRSADGQGGDIERARSYTQMYTDAMERVLGIAPGTLVMMDEAVLQEWFA